MRPHTEGGVDAHVLIGRVIIQCDNRNGRSTVQSDAGEGCQMLRDSISNKEKIF